MLGACLPGLEHLIEIGLPIADLVSRGLPKSVTAWHVDRRGKRIGQLATHEVAGVELCPIAAKRSASRLTCTICGSGRRPHPISPGAY